MDCNRNACFHAILTGCVLNGLWGILLRKTIERQLPVYPQLISQQSPKQQTYWSLMELLRAQNICKFKYHTLGFRNRAYQFQNTQVLHFPSSSAQSIIEHSPNNKHIFRRKARFLLLPLSKRSTAKNLTQIRDPTHHAMV